MMRACLATLALGLSAATADAACFADYKAKREVPAQGFGFSETLRLHYGVAKVPEAACSAQAAGREIADRIAADGWTLLRVISIFDETGLDGRRREAGDYFLRY